MPLPHSEARQPTNDPAPGHRNRRSGGSNHNRTVLGVPPAGVTECRTDAASKRTPPLSHPPGRAAETPSLRDARSRIAPHFRRRAAQPEPLILGHRESTRLDLRIRQRHLRGRAQQPEERGSKRGKDQRSPHQQNTDSHKPSEKSVSLSASAHRPQPHDRHFGCGQLRASAPPASCFSRRAWTFPPSVAAR